MASAPAWLETLLWLVQALQAGLLALADALGLLPRLDGQPLWPWRWRLATEMLRVDQGLARQLALALAAIALCAPAVVLACWRRTRRAGLALAAAALLIGLLPMSALLQPAGRAALLAAATPTEFHHSAAGFDSAAIAAGAPLYAAHCAGCHGESGRGDGPLAASLPMWPPDLARGLLWQRSEGAQFWAVRQGLQAASGSGRTRLRHEPTSGADAIPTMPAFAATLSDREIWAVLAYLQALAAGQGLQREGRWISPVPVPALEADCGAGPGRFTLTPGQRQRIVAGTAAPLPDPRLRTLLLLPPDAGESAIEAESADCISRSAEAWQAFALIAGLSPQALAGSQFLADRDGWLRALGSARQDWSDGDMVCRSAASPSEPAIETPAGDGLGRLIARMDAEPLRPLRGAYFH
ncbi:c-type cytochrome [Azoarcus indigens]|uniref:Mono/diheme cytochrome c family protein n=1 Tax=Azoarcus indigens TaxID=29545 RepID=A0A4R6EF56_9RHOO|nr:cytochrome c [Azoarcus indigens]NMG63354.1 c-type cytochrome [Azoarcus indigens]TDN56906.1 mono/diheme cytochrome c family protein [Azoarcus indigens]